ncbi:L-ornithine N5-oxygenase [Actinocrispum wychmicini]|uniref:L-lysine N6-monooxygenase MbtG n=1 Tax=Actinocrispum wychmicini TaxID=1213861 RepID=A0A4R2JIX6_9PSEU|nr:L-ornithine N5-oxygenase [Actinocrispum wychmicini]
MIREVELLAIGAGPSSLGLAVAVEELAPDLADSTLVVDRAEEIQWQQGMLLPWAKSQVSFLKDLVTPRDPCSRFSFLNFLRATGRLDEFVTMGTSLPYRLEISEYLRWVANGLTRVRTLLGNACVSVEPQRDRQQAVTGWLTRLADGSAIASRYLVFGVGRDPHIPGVFRDLPADRVVHSTAYRQRIAQLPKGRRVRVALVGGSQSAAEMFRALREDLPDSEIDWLIRSVALNSDESSKFTNELYYPSFVDEFHAAEPGAREQILREMRGTNYSCVTPPMLESIYADLYLDRLHGRDGRRLITMVDVTAARETGGEVVLDLTDRRTGVDTRLRCDLVVLGTGFDSRMPKLVRGLAGSLGLDRISVTRQYRLDLDEPAACYLQGVNEDTHGIADSLLSVLARRAEEITLDIIEHRALMRRPATYTAAS